MSPDELPGSSPDNGPDQTLSPFAEMVRQAAATAREQQIEQERLEQMTCKPDGTTPAERNEQRLDAALRRALPPNAAGGLQRILDRTLDTLYDELGLRQDEVRALLIECRDPHRLTRSLIEPRARDALGNLSEVVAACEEPTDAASAKFRSAAGLSRDSLLSGRAAARARVTGGSANGEQRKQQAADKHAKWCDAAQRLLVSGRDPHQVASMVARAQGANVRTVRNVLQRAGLLGHREKKGN